MTTAPLIAGIELGGTKCICILGRGPDDIVAEKRIPTTKPEETLSAIEAVLDGWKGFKGLGIGSFGPISINRSADDYGYVTGSAKKGWAGTDIGQRLAKRYGVPTGFHTDVVGAALGEGRWGAARGLDDFAYMTVGTGIGVGVIADGAPVDGMTHAELGHIRPARLKGDDWAGSCPFHGDCVEGLASGTAIAARTGTEAPDLAKDDPAWDGVAHALAQLCHTLVATGVPRRIVMGGGVMNGIHHLFPSVRQALVTSLADYVRTPELEDIERYVVPAKLGNDAGPLGAIVLGAKALEEGR